VTKTSTRTSRTSGLVAALALGTLGLAACGPGGGSYGSSGTTNSSTAAASSATVAGAALTTKNTTLGTVVADGRGRTVYAFDKDTRGSGTSACTGGCAGLWPAVHATGGSSSVTGVSGTVGTITRDDGTKQVTLDGRPLYTYSGDAAAGDVAGQGFMGIWWVVAPDGSEMSAGASSSSGY
jgi:predicted lipoprotein with Yx(FWY)xxD motif